MRRAVRATSSAERAVSSMRVYAGVLDLRTTHGGVLSDLRGAIVRHRAGRVVRAAAVNPLVALRSRFRRFPDPTDAAAVRRLCADQWRGIAQRTPVYLNGYLDRPGSQDRAQRRAEWIADCFSGEHLWASVLEVGCGCGRNLAAIQRRWGIGPHVLPFVIGVDICPEAIKAAQETAPSRSSFRCADVVALREWPDANIVLTCGFLGHIPPADLPGLLRRMLSVPACRSIVMVEEPGHGEVAKGPRAWGAEKNTGAYVLWRHDFDRVLAALGHQAKRTPLPEDLRATAATEMLVVERA